MGRRSGFRADRLRAGEWVIGIASLALVIDLFLPWYTVRAVFSQNVPDPGSISDYTATQAYHVLGPYALLCGLFGLVVWGAQSMLRGPAVPLCLTVISSLLDAILLIALIIRVVFDQFSIPVGTTPGTDLVKLAVPAVIGMFLAALMLAGAWISLREDGIAAKDAPQRIETLRLAQRRS